MSANGFSHMPAIPAKFFLVFGLLAALLLVSCSAAVATEPTQAPAPTQPVEPTVIFSGEGCTYLGPEELSVGEVVLNLQRIDQAFAESAVMVMTLYENKTVADLQAWESTDKPGWAELVTGKVLKDAEEDSFIIKVSRGPVFLVCFVSPPEKKIGVIGPIPVIE